jgi:hypothetical protein
MASYPPQLLHNRTPSYSEFASVLIELFVGQCVVSESKGNIYEGE